MWHSATPPGIVVSLILAVTASSVAAQTPTEGDIMGVVVEDGSMTVLPGAHITITQPDRSAVAGTDGAFTFEGLPSGRVSVRVEMDGYVNLQQDVQVFPGGLTVVRFEVPPLASVLGEIAVAVNGGGSVVTASSDGATHAVVNGAVRRERSLTAVDLLDAQVAGVTVRRLGTSHVDIKVRGLPSVMDVDGGVPAVYVDGSRVRSLDFLFQIPASDVKHIEVLKGATSMSRFPDSPNGVIVITTRGGVGEVLFQV